MCQNLKDSHQLSYPIFSNNQPKIWTNHTWVKNSKARSQEVRFTEMEFMDPVSNSTMHLTFKFKNTTKWGSVVSGAERSTVSGAAPQTGFPDTISAWSYVFPSHKRLDERHQEDRAVFHRWEVCKCVPTTTVSTTSGGGANYLYKYM